MIAARAGVWIVFALFMALSIEVLWQFGAAGFLSAAFDNLATTLVFVDLAIALSLLLVLMARDAGTSGRRVWPFVLLTLSFGSAGPLLYLALHPGALGLSRASKTDGHHEGAQGNAAYGTAPGR
jgi:cytochrome bd-type quinol oxidase subunit 2